MRDEWFVVLGWGTGDQISKPSAGRSSNREGNGHCMYEVT